MDKRDITVKVRLTKKEKEQLEAYSTAFNMSKSDILRSFTNWWNDDYQLTVHKALKNMFCLQRAEKAVKDGTIERIDFKGVIFERERHAHWERIENSMRFRCSNCQSVAFDINEFLTISDFRYCPYCGALFKQNEEKQ